VIARLRVLVELLENPRGRLLIRVLFITTAITFTLLPFVRFLHSGTQMDYRTWFDAGQTVLRGSELYPHTQNFPFMYPPTCALLLAGPAFFGKPAMILILTSLNTMAWILCIRLSSALMSEQRAQNAPIVIASFIVIPFVWSSYHLGQPSLVLLALMLGAFLSLRHGQEILAGALVALAVAIKAFPLLAIFYFVYRRYWMAAISLVITLVILLFLLPIPFRGWHQTLNDARDWQRGMLHYEQGGIAQRPERGYCGNAAPACAGRGRAGIRRTFKPDPDFYAARLRLLICLANVSARAPDQTELGSTGIADLAVDRARAFNRDGDRAAPGTNLWQPVFRWSHALSRARDRSSPPVTRLIAR